MSQEVNFNTIDKTLEMAKKNGVDNIDVIISGQDSFSLKSEKGDLSEYKKANSHSLGIRVIVDDKVGMSFTEAIDDESIQSTIESAKKNAQYGKVNPHEKITAIKNEIVDINPKANVDYNPEVDAMIEKALFLEQEVLKREKLATNAPYNGLVESKVSAVIGNSLGNRCLHQSKAYTCYTSALLNDNDKNAMHFESDTKRDFRDLDYDKCINNSINIAKSLLDADQIKTGNYDVIFEPNLFHNIFSMFNLMFSAKSVIDKTSPWREEMGNQVISDKLSFVDSPYFSDGFNNFPFDSEGNQKRENILVENGKLNQFIHNSATASELGLENNFCASRSSKSTLGVGLSNFIIKTGKDNHSDLTKKSYVEIIKAQGLHSGIRPISGDFSLGVSGRVWRDGEIVSYFKDVTVNGNFFKMLKDVDFVGDKLLSSDDKTFFTPAIIFPSLSIAGK